MQITTLSVVGVQTKRTVESEKKFDYMGSGCTDHGGGRDCLERSQALEREFCTVHTMIGIPNPQLPLLSLKQSLAG